MYIKGTKVFKLL